MDVFQAISEPTRREILEILAKKGEMSSSEIGENFSISPPAISQHLKILKKVHLVQMEKRAQRRIYRLNSSPIKEVGSWANHMIKLWNQRFDKLEKLLEEEK